MFMFVLRKISRQGRNSYFASESPSHGRIDQDVMNFWSNKEAI